MESRRATLRTKLVRRCPQLSLPVGATWSPRNVSHKVTRGLCHTHPRAGRKVPAPPGIPLGVSSAPLTLALSLLAGQALPAALPRSRPQGWAESWKKQG